MRWLKEKLGSCLILLASLIGIAAMWLLDWLR